ncbi:uncharacterized protein LOC122090560 isoform X2 [Macadamia integrifolia]|uniref:uncharacterized protein LOC122090560 isoform X2 n=1 Tax=Macadamia integrifolia TaxID=60698 RepID=UPI001C4EE0E6|nr:uncharacterized protein LOC122090560 isoform X2 [Macadamia integrifolia]
MGSSASPMLIDANDRDGKVGEEDAFLEFVEYARSVLSSEDKLEFDGMVDDNTGPGWSWIVSRILRCCITYSSGVTAAILLSELSQAWNEHQRAGASRRPQCAVQLKRKHRRTRLSNTVTIDSIYEKNFLSANSILEAVVVNVFVLPGTNIFMLSLGDIWSSSTIDLYLHRRYYDLVDSQNGILKQGREIFLTGCCLRTMTEGSGYPRLLPTEYLVILLDEDQDEDAMLLGAQFCSDSFSSISLDAFKDGTSYSFYARIESIGSLELQGKFSSLQRTQITLVDNDGVKINFLLWGEQVILANIFSVGSMLALDRPFIASTIDSSTETVEELCLEYGSATQLYLVPFIHHEEQVCVASTQGRYHGSRMLNALGESQAPTVSQVTLPCDSRGSIDFSHYPFRQFVVDLRDKMSSISLYVVVKDIFRERNTTENIYSLTIEDATGVVSVKLHFVGSWSLGRLGIGNMIYICGLTCYMTTRKRLEVSWFEKDVGSQVVNLSSLPALINSSCLHKLSCLSDLSIKANATHICHVRLNQIEHCHVDTRLSHALCGNFVNDRPDGQLECNFCCCTCDKEVIHSFLLKITLADENAKVFAWCTGQTATELLQISPVEFYELPEEEQAMYPSSLENEEFMVAIVNCKREINGLCNGLNLGHDPVMWEITCALKCE